jgi:hypothetical protein
LRCKTAGVVAIEAARDQDLQEKSVLVEAAGCNDQAAMSEDAVAPDIAAGEQDKTRIVVVAGMKATAAVAGIPKSGGSWRRRR